MEWFHLSLKGLVDLANDQQTEEVQYYILISVIVTSMNNSLKRGDHKESDMYKEYLKSSHEAYKEATNRGEEGWTGVKRYMDSE